MTKPVLVILAAGMGSRYGGLKQIEGVDPEGHLLIDFSIYDAVRAGFDKIVCIIKEEMQADFDAAIGHRLRGHVDIKCVYQGLNDLPAGYAPPVGRVRPWGTSQALLACRDTLDGPFAVINADDYYGPRAISAIYEFLCVPRRKGEYAMVGYQLKNTLTEHGTVTRGVCRVSRDGMLEHIQETRNIGWGKHGPARLTQDGEIPVAAEAVVSMNLWGFGPELIPALTEKFPVFLDTTLLSDPLTAEYLLPTTVQELLEENKASVRVLPCSDHWFGVTYREDRDHVAVAVEQLKNAGVYPRRLWQ